MSTITLAGGDWNNIYSLAGIAVGTAVTIQVQSGVPVLFREALTKPSQLDVTGARKYNGEPIVFNATSSGAWAYPTSGNAQVEVLPAYSKLSILGDQTSRAILYGNTLDRIATQALNYRDDAVARGLGYYAYYNQSIASGAKSYARFVVPADKYVVLTAREIVTDNTKLIYRTYTTWTGGVVGAAIPVKRLRNDSIYPPTSTINAITGATPDLATDVTNLPIYGGSGVGGRVAGSTDSADTFRLLAPNSQFLIEWENQSGSAIAVYTQYTWFELSPLVII